jgi:iron complex outermembrane receptor protein
LALSLLSLLVSAPLIASAQSSEPSGDSAIAPPSVPTATEALEATSTDNAVVPHNAAEPPPLEAAPVEVLVVGRSAVAVRGASDYRITPGQLTRIPGGGAESYLRLAPGVLLTGDGSPGHADQVFLRGFDARLGQDLEFSVDGMPINQVGHLEGNGYADLSFLIPEVVNELRVLEGPYEPQQGNFAVAGSADFRLGVKERGQRLKASVGSFNSHRILALWAPPSEVNQTFGAVALAESDGYGEGRAFRQGQGIAQYARPLGERGMWRTTAMASASSAGHAGVLRQDDLDAGRVGFFDSYDTWQGAEAQRLSVSAELLSRGERDSFGLLGYGIRQGSRLRENYTGYLLDVQEPFQSPHQQRGDRIDRTYSGTTLGVRAYGRRQGRPDALIETTEVGMIARSDFLDTEQYRVQTSNGLPYAKDVSLGARVHDLGLYVDTSLRLLSWMRLRGGIRAESYFYDLEDRCASSSLRFLADSTNGDASCHSQQPEGDYREPSQNVSAVGLAYLPRATLLLGPFDGFAFNLAAGRGARSIDPVYVNAGSRTPLAMQTAYEGGVAYAHSHSSSVLAVRSVFFQTRVEQDLVFSQTEGRNSLAPGTTRTGWAGSLRWTGDWLDTNDTLTLVRATFDDNHLLIPYVPPMALRSDTVAHHELPIRLLQRPVTGSIGLGMSYLSARPLQYGQWGEPVFTCDASAGLEWEQVELELAVQNLFDFQFRAAEYNYVSNVSPQAAATLVPARHFMAGAPRTVLLSLTLAFGEES